MNLYYELIIGVIFNNIKVDFECISSLSVHFGGLHPGNSIESLIYARFDNQKRKS